MLRLASVQLSWSIGFGMAWAPDIEGLVPCWKEFFPRGASQTGIPCFFFFPNLNWIALAFSERLYLKCYKNDGFVTNDINELVLASGQGGGWSGFQYRR